MWPTQSLAALAGYGLLFVSGCASLPDVNKLDVIPGVVPVQLKDEHGPLSQDQSASVYNRLKHESGESGILERHMAWEEAIVGAPLVLGNKAVLLQDGPATYKAMFSAIRKARKNINLETYIFDDDEIGRQFADLLIQKQNQGVQVNLIYDSVGAINTPQAFFDRLKASGVRVVEFNPVNPLSVKKEWLINNRDHRKLLIVDGHTAFLGGINISGVYSRGSFAKRSASKTAGAATNWRDTHVQIEGPVVADFQKLFLETWQK
ncbi:MAG: phospholipase D-like domain-containing protein [Sulfuricaulis sp.]